MNYYPFHIGDYAAHTAHLDPIEDIAYRRLLDRYYLTEQPLPDDETECARQVRMREHVDVVRRMLAEFFRRGPDGWRHDRCDAEIERAQDKSEKARASAMASVEARKRTLSERSANAERPLNGRSAPKSQEPRAKEETGEEERADAPAPGGAPALRRRATAIPEGFPDAEAMDWCRGKRPELRAEHVAQVFRDHHLAHGSTMKDWRAAWRTWVGKERAPYQPRGSPAGPTSEERQAAKLSRLTGGLYGSQPDHPRTIDVEAVERTAPRLAAAGR